MLCPIQHSDCCQFHDPSYHINLYMALLLLNEGDLNLTFVANLKLIVESFLQVVENFNNYELSKCCNNF